MGLPNVLKRVYATLWRIFSAIKLKRRQQIGRKVAIHTVLLRMRGLEGFLQEAAKNFDLFLKCKIKIKNFKHIVVDEQNNTTHADLIWQDSITLKRL